MPKKSDINLPPQCSKGSVHADPLHSICGKELLDALASLQHDSRYSDLTITCGHESYAVHRCIVSTRSDFFAKACDGKFKEASTGEIVLDEDPTLVKQVIEYLYTSDYQVDTYIASPDSCMSDDNEALQTNKNGVSDLSNELASISNPLSFHILMYSLADRLFIQGLKALSKQNVERELMQQLNANSFSRAIIEIYRSTPKNERGLRDLAVKITMNHLTALRSTQESGTAAFQNNLLLSVPQFSYDLLVEMKDKSVFFWSQDKLFERDWLMEYIGI